MSTSTRTGAKGALHTRGFTLVELMVVVTILGILAAISIPMYQSYVYRSKQSEAIGFLAEIKHAQETYRADFGTYCDVAAGGDVEDALYPSAVPGQAPQQWSSPAPDNWVNCGIRYNGTASYFVYSTAAGLPGTLPGSRGFNGDLGYNGSDFWFVSIARGDLDGDGQQVSFESYSHSQTLWSGGEY